MSLDILSHEKLVKFRPISEALRDRSHESGPTYNGGELAHNVMIGALRLVGHLGIFIEAVAAVRGLYYLKGFR